MYCKEYNCLFVHIPKTAGKSIESYFLGLLGLRWEDRAPLLLRANDDPTRGPERLAHMTAREYVELGYLTQDQFDSAFRFAFVRNPWARLVSEYRYRKHYLRFGFRDFVLHQLPQASMRDTYRHIVPQSEFLLDNNGELSVNYVGRFENLQADFNEVCNLLKLNPVTLPHVDDGSGAALTALDRVRELLGMRKEAAHNHYSGYYDAETRGRVAELYAQDIEVFGYSFESRR